jgi:hypothetical protein
MDEIISLLDFLLTVGFIIGFVVIVVRLGHIIRQLESINLKWTCYKDSGFGGNIDIMQMQDLLPHTVKCTHCGEELDINFGERVFRRYKCPECSGLNNHDDGGSVA